MAAMASKTHRPSALKQQNKKHNKLGHKTNRQALAQCQGRVSTSSIASKKDHRRVVSKNERRLQVQNSRKNKKQAVLDLKRRVGYVGADLVLGSTSVQSPPHLVTLLMLCPDTNPHKLLRALTGADEGAVLKHSATGHLHFICTRFKTRFEFVIPPINDLFANLDASKVSNTALVVWPVLADRYSSALTPRLQQLVACVKAQGLPAVVHATLGYHGLPNKKQNDLLKSLGADIKVLFPDKARLFHLDRPGDPLLCLRQLSSQAPKGVWYRDHRPHLLGEEWGVVEGEDGVARLQVSGFVRGAPLSPSALVHLSVTGSQDCRVESVLIRGLDPYAAPRKGGGMAEPAEDVLLLPDPSKEQDLEVTGAREEAGEEESEDSEEEEDEFKAPSGEDEDSDVGGDDDEAASDGDDNMSTVSDSVMGDDKYDDKMDYDEELDNYERMKDAESHAQFPDEVDTPHDEFARERFAKYRGLESFKNSPWDLEADLPDDYEKIVHIPRFDHFRRKIVNQQAEDKEEIKAMPGQYVTVTIKEFPTNLIDEHKKTGSPLVLFGLLPLEQKMSLVNLVLNSRSASHSEPIKSKDAAVFQVGFRRFVNTPVFSEHTLGKKHKMVRYFSPGSTVVASLYAPMLYPPAPVLCLRRAAPAAPLRLIATGSVLSADTQRCVLKRIVLSGHPFKIHKRTVTVRYMFFNKEDIAYFKSIQLHTKYGRRGWIKDSLGTHGHMKCTFDSHLKSEDTVCMTLYKRVFPKWGYDTRVETASVMGGDEVSGESASEDDMEEEGSDAARMPPPKKSCADKAVRFRL